jgi:2-polyprenyl-3-methyl-5-hydroxy-6-metoxy-1,4-benzoquinol methylase
MPPNPELSAPAHAETADIETSSDGYAARFGGPVGAWMLSVQERIALAMLAELPAGAAVLDVGGGHGQLAGPLCREGYAVTVLGSAESCRRRIAELVDGGRCRFVTGNVIGLPFPDRSFDAAISFRLLPHCEAWPALIGELCRVARRAVIVDYPTSQSVNAVAPALFGAKKKLEGNTRAWRLFRHAEVAGEFRRSGYACRQRAGQFFLPMVLHRVLHCRPLSAGLEAACRSAGLTRRWGSPVIVDMRRSE